MSIKIVNVATYGWEAAIRGMRSPLNSWNKSDSFPAVDCGKCGRIEREGCCTKEGRDCTGFECFEVGPNDLDLMKRLAANGPVHAKYRRMIIVTCDITAPLYWWKEFDTSKVGTVANSCSTMHTIHKKMFTISDFSTDHLMIRNKQVMETMVNILNAARHDYLVSGDKQDWWQMIQLLPSSYNQQRTVQMNYEVLTSMYRWRKDHKLDEWREFCKWVESLPYAEVIVGERQASEPCRPEESGAGKA